MQKGRPYISLEAMEKMLKLRYLGHVTNVHQSLENDIMLRIVSGGRNADDIKIITELSVNYLKQLLQARKKVTLVSEQHIQEKDTDRYLIQGDGNGKPLRACCQIHAQGIPGILDIR